MILTLVFWSISLSAYSQNAGGIQSPFELGGSARLLGMGGVGTALTGDGSSFFVNPASLETLSEQEILTFHAPLVEDSAYDALGYVLPIGSHDSFGVALEQEGTPGGLITTTGNNSNGTFSNQEIQGLLGYGFGLDDNLSLGANVKYDRQTLYTYEDSGMGLDLGLLYQLGSSADDLAQFGLKNLSVGFSVSNFIAPESHLDQMGDSPARVYRPALSYHYLSPGLQTSLWISVEGQITQGGTQLVAAGLEYGLNNFLFGRVGYDGVSPTAGAGLRWEGLEFDYAFNQRDLGALQRFSLTYSFGKYQDPLVAQKMNTMKFIAKTYDRENEYDAAIQAWNSEWKEFPDDGEAPAAITDLQKRRQDALEKYIEESQDAMTNGNLDQAVRAMSQGLSLDPTNPSIKKMLSQVNQELVLTSNYMRGTEAYSREDYKSAVEYLGMVYQIDPKYRNTAFLYHDAQSHYMPLESMSKESTDLYAKGVNAYMDGKYQTAIDEWSKVLEKEPKNYLVQRNIAEAQEQLDEKPQADDSGTQK
jgi:tetratricopeptide (TPR) repeat protein